MRGGSLTVIGTTFIGNYTTGTNAFGTAIDFDNTSVDSGGNASTGNLLVENCVFSGNTAASVGGSAIEADETAGNGTMQILNSSFLNNSVTSTLVNGGAWK